MESITQEEISAVQEAVDYIRGWLLGNMPDYVPTFDLLVTGWNSGDERAKHSLMLVMYSYCAGLDSGTSKALKENNPRFIC